MPRKDTQFNSETGRKAGKKSKRKPLDMGIKEQLEKFLDDKKMLELLRAAYMHFEKGNPKPLQYLMNRGLGTPTMRQEIRNLSMENNPLYQQLKELTKQNKK